MTAPAVGPRLDSPVRTQSVRLQAAINEVMHHQWSHSRPAMHALQVLIEEAENAVHEIDALHELLRQVRTNRDELAGSHYANLAAVREQCAATLMPNAEVSRLPTATQTQEDGTAPPAVGGRLDRRVRRAYRATPPHQHAATGPAGPQEHRG